MSTFIKLFPLKSTGSWLAFNSFGYESVLHAEHMWDQCGAKDILFLIQWLGNTINSLWFHYISRTTLSDHAYFSPDLSLVRLIWECFTIELRSHSAIPWKKEYDEFNIQTILLLPSCTILAALRTKIAIYGNLIVSWAALTFLTHNGVLTYYSVSCNHYDFSTISKKCISVLGT